MVGVLVKAFLLAGGRGERLRPLTLRMPKCMVPINGRPLLAIWLELCARHGIDDILLNVSQHPDMVREFLHHWRATPRVELVVESEPRGTAGTIADQRHFVDGESSFWVLYSDNLTDVDLSAMATAHAGHTGLLTMGLFRAPNPRAAGIVQLGPDDRVVDFVEKPVQPMGDLANAGIYLARGALLDGLPTAASIVDFGHDVLPSLVGRMYGHVLDGFIRDIGTPEALAEASAFWRQQKGSSS
ncbi:MAG: NDP-sugar synthase [Vicinamibacterales bacterium]